MGAIRFSKVVSNLPQQLEPDTIYLVRTGNGFDLYCTDTTGSIAYQVENATKLRTARTITIGNTSKSFDGSANVSWSLAEIGVTGVGGTFETGDILLTAKTLTAPDWLPANGTVYLQSSYPALFAKVGIIHDPRAPWTQRTSSFGINHIQGVAYGNGLFVAVGSSGKLATSPDGINWTQRTSSFETTAILGVTYGNGLFVAVGGGGKLATSPDGINWTQRTSGFETIAIQGVTYGNGLFVAVGGGGKLATSPDGINWTQRTSGFETNHIYGVAYSNGLFVAVGSSGKLATSPDGISWTQRTSSFETNHIRGVAYGNGLFVAVGDSGKLATSSDGISWTQRTSSFETTAILGVTYGNGLFVAVGNSGKLTTLGRSYDPATQFITPIVENVGTGIRAYVKT